MNDPKVRWRSRPEKAISFVPPQEFPKYIGWE
jgi:hypothetical protein